MSVLDRSFPLRLYQNPVLRRRAIGTYVSALALIIGSLAIALILPVQSTIFTPLQLGLSIASVVLFAGAGFAAIFLTRQGRQVAAARILISGFFIVPMATALTGVLSSQAFVAVAMALISFAGFLLGGRSPIFIFAASWLVFTITFAQSALNVFWWGSYFAVFMPTLIGHTVLSYLLGQSLPNVALQVQKQGEDRRVKLADASTALSQQILGARLDLDGLVKQVIGLVRDMSGEVDNVQVYLINPTRTQINLVASTALDQGLPKSIGVGSLTLVGRVVSNNTSICVRADDPDSEGERSYLRSYFLAETKTQLAIPMQVGSTIIGVLDIHSASPYAFEAEAIRTFETLANQVSVAVDNARLYTEAQAQLLENKRLYEQTRASLREIERLNQKLTAEAWSDYLTYISDKPAYSLDTATGAVEPSAPWTTTMAEASTRNEVITRTADGQKTIAFPIAVNGQVIGVMEFDVPEDRTISDEQVLVLQQVTDRLALTVENTRLFDDTRRVAQREAMVNSISTRIQSMTSVDAVLSTATRSLGDAIKANRVSVRLGTPPTELA